MNSSDLSEIITNTINSLFQNLFSSIDNNLYSILDNIVFLNEDLFKDSYFQSIFGTNSSSGILIISNSLLIGFLLYYSIKLFLSYYSQSQVERPYQFLFKIIIIGIVMNNSYFICEKFLSINSLISSAIINIGENIFSKSIGFESFINELNKVISINGNSFDLFSLDGILKSFCTIGLLNLVFSYSLRYIMVKVLILLSPFAFLSLSLINSSWFFKTWFRSLLSLLFLQSLVALILLIIFSLNFNKDIFSKFIYVGAIYSLSKANTYIKELMGGISTEFNYNLNNIKTFLKAR